MREHEPATSGGSRNKIALAVNTWGALPSCSRVFNHPAPAGRTRGLDMQARRWNAERLRQNVRRFSRNYPRATLYSILAVMIVAYCFAIKLKNDHYANSPAGKAEAAREAAASKAATEAEWNNAMTEVDLAGLKVWLKDPESAQFTLVRHFKDREKEVTCGYVNSRNGFGGMAGAERFAVNDHKVYLAGYGRKMANEIDKICGVR